jgi:hypothetical protein
MATQALTTPASAWNTAFSKYQDLLQRLEQAQPHDAEPINVALATLQDYLMTLPAPNLAAIVHKLGILFETDLAKPDRDGDEKRLVLADLRHLAADTHELVDSQT